MRIQVIEDKPALFTEADLVDMLERSKGESLFGHTYEAGLEDEVRSEDLVDASHAVHSFKIEDGILSCELCVLSTESGKALQKALDDKDVNVSYSVSFAKSACVESHRILEKFELVGVDAIIQKMDVIDEEEDKKECGTCSEVTGSSVIQAVEADLNRLSCLYRRYHICLEDAKKFLLICLVLRHKLSRDQIRGIELDAISGWSGFPSGTLVLMVDNNEKPQRCDLNRIESEVVSVFISLRNQRYPGVEGRLFINRILENLDGQIAMVRDFFVSKDSRVVDYVFKQFLQRYQGGV